MKIKKEKDGTYSITGMTFGKLLAMQAMCNVAERANNGQLSAVQEDVRNIISQSIKATDEVNPNALSEEKMWKLIEKANWEKAHDYDGIRSKFEKELSKEECQQLHDFVHEQQDKLQKKFEQDWLGDPGIDVSDDGWSDLTAEVVGRGKKFYDTITVKKLQKMAKEGDYNESFIYALQFDFIYHTN